ncbi:MAG: mechanosensitive ion channel family protein, partial [Oscillospiraceae bacterium]|nr:mechanosensitive ion channel family protein [Oscillospiraceae bacterium]
MDKITFFDRLGEILDRVMSFTVGSLTLGKLFSALLLLAVCLTGVKILMRMVDRLLQKGDIPKTLHTFIRSAAKVILLLLTFLLVAERLDIDVTSLITVMGVAGLAVSL